MNICIIHMHLCRVCVVLFLSFFAFRRSLLPQCFSDEILEVCNEDINITSQLVNGYEFSLFFFLSFINIHDNEMRHFSLMVIEFTDMFSSIIQAIATYHDMV